jgi:predicted transcriptional regulator of viral defense system
MPGATDRTRALDLARRASGVSARDLDAAGIHRQVLTRLVNQGRIVRVARGVYRVAEQPVSESHALAVASATVPQGVVCLLSALQFHGLGTHLPSEIWIALDRRAWRPKRTWPPLRVVRFTGQSLTQGIERHPIEGREVKVYGVAKTLADCFKYRNKIGLDVALEALRDAWRRRRFTLDELDRYAAICRVQRVMKPYLEAMTT